MPNYVYPFIALTGGGTGALDVIDGTALADLDMAYGSVAGVTYTYLLDVDSAAAEASPGIIAPDANGGDKRWILQKVAGGISTIASGSLPAAAVLDIISIPATYAYLVLQITGASCDTTSRFLIAQISTDNGSSFESTGYSGYRYTTSAVADNANIMNATSNSVPTDLHTACLVISAYHGGMNAKYTSRVNHTNSTDINITEGFFTGGTDAINAIRIMWSGAGSFDAGTYALYGVS